MPSPKRQDFLARVDYERFRISLVHQGKKSRFLKRRKEFVMSRAWQAERAMDREVQSLENDLAEGRITHAQYRESLRELERDLRGAYEEDLYDAQQAVKDEWGW